METKGECEAPARRPPSAAVQVDGPTTAHRSLRRLRTAHTLAQLGDGAFYVTSAVYLVRQGWSPFRVGLALALAWGLGALLAPRIGRLADTRGLAVVTTATMAACAVALAVLALGAPFTLVPALLLYAAVQSAWSGLRASLVEALTDRRSRLAERALLQRLGNGAVAVGSLLGGASLTVAGLTGLRLALLLDAVAYAIVAVVVARGVKVTSAHVVRAERRRLSGDQWAATAAASALYLYMPLLSVALPVMVATNRSVAPWTVAACFAANTIGVMAIQGRAAAAVRTAERARRSVLIGAVLLAASCALLWQALLEGHVLLLGPALLAQVLGEVRFAAAAWDLGYRLAGPGDGATWQSTYGSAIPVARCLGPALLAPMAAVGAGWTLPAVLFVLGGITLAVVATRATRVTHPTSRVPMPA